MTKANKQTERSMYLSVISTVLCVVMLVGMTFAWFTATVESDQNVITTAPFEVKVYWSADITSIPATSTDAEDAQAWTSLSNSTPFNETEYLPGEETVRYIAFYNKSPFDVKFDVSLRAITSATNDLLNALEIYTVDTVTAGNAVTTAAMTKKGTAKELQNNDEAALVQIGSSIVDEAAANAETVKVIAVAVKLPDSYSQSVSQTVNFFIKVIASQWNVDHGTESYATVTANTTTNTLDANFVAYDAPAENQNTTVAISGVDANENDAVTLSVQTDSTDVAASKFSVAAGQTAVAGIDLTLTNASGNPVTFYGGEATITTYIAKNLTGVAVSYNGTGDQPTLVSYDPATGKLVFTTTHFSEYVVTSTSTAYVKSEDKAYDSLPAAVAAAISGDTVVLLKDTTGDRLSILKNITIDGSGHTLTDTNTSGRAIWVDESNVTLNLKNLTIDGADKCQRGVQVNVLDSGDTNFSTVIMDNCTIKNVTHYAINLCSNTTVNLTVNNSSISGYAAINAYGSGNIINVNNSILEGKNPYSGAYNAFCTICLEGDTTLATQLHSSDYIITINNSKIIASRTGDQPEAALGFNTNAANSVVNFNNCTFDIGEGCYFAYDISGDTTTNSIVIDNETLEYPTNVYFNIN